MKKKPIHEFDILTELSEPIKEKLKYIPEPSFFFEVGQEVELGHLDGVVILSMLEFGKVYTVSYNKSTSKGEFISKGVRQVAWTDINPIVDVSHDHGFRKNDDLLLEYSQRTCTDILLKAYSMGIDFEVDYQRDYVWTLFDKQDLIDSMFNNVDIGKFVFVQREYREHGEQYEILDGKQRVRAILDYTENRFPYKGVFFNQLTSRERMRIRNYTVSMCTLQEHSLTEENKLRLFIMLNTAGRVMDSVHLDKVKKMYSEITRGMKD